jgi:hypothetical protein
VRGISIITQKAQAVALEKPIKNSKLRIQNSQLSQSTKSTYFPYALSLTPFALYFFPNQPN